MTGTSPSHASFQDDNHKKQRRHFATTSRSSSRSHSVVRKGPLWVGMALFVIVPSFVMMVMSTTVTIPETKLDDPRPQLESESSWVRRGVGESDSRSVSSSEKSIITLKEKDVIEIVVVDTRNRIWVLKDGKENGNYRPVRGQRASSTESPQMAAQRIVAQAFGLLPQTSPTASNGPQQEWILLGRHATTTTTTTTTSSKHEKKKEANGTSLYSYLLQNVPGSPSDTNAQRETVAIPKQEIQQALLDGKFSHVESVATVTMAMLQLARNGQ